MAYKKDLTGMVFGKLTVLEQDLTKPKGGATYWKCQCSCENKTIKTFRRDALTRTEKPVRDCGCGNLEKRRANIDLTSQIGKKYGKLTVIKRDLSKPIGHGEPSYWLCQCDCGNPELVSVVLSSLTRNKTQSCGCAHIDAAKRNIKDITGQRFGMLIAQKCLNKVGADGTYLWRFKCDCGNENCIHTLTEVQELSYPSCGCFIKSQSKGEIIIKNILKENKINFSEQYFFPDLRGVGNGYLRFDFVITDKDYPFQLIEYDGIQHYQPISHFGGEEDFQIRQTHDKIKNEYCKSHNIPLKRIPYTDLDNITLESIMGDKYLLE